MILQRMIKICGGVGLSGLLLLVLNGCSSTHHEAPVTSATTGSSHASSFASSSVCADNPFLQKYQCSFARIEQAARSGDPDAQYALGYLYYYGIGTTQDRQAGLVWIRKAAAQGQSVAQEALRTLATAPAATKKSLQTTNASSDSGAAATTTSPAATQPAQPEKPLTDYLPNYGEKRVDTTATPPSVNLSGEQ
jgi:hypothetical protein